MWGQQQQGGYGGGYGGNMGGGYGGNMGGGYGGNIGGNTGGAFGGGNYVAGFIPNPGQWYKIVSAVHPNFCLDSSGSTFSKNQSILYNYHGGSNQRWQFQPYGNGAYLIINCENGGCLEAEENASEPGGQCYTDDGRYPDSQAWKIIPGQGAAQGRGVHIVMADDGFCLDISGQDYSDNTRVITWYNESKPNQTWQILPA